MSKQYVYLFRDSDASMRNLLGGKGANLGEMIQLGLPVPQGFTVTTEACLRYYEDGEKLADEIVEQIENAMKDLEEIEGKKFGDADNPFLVSIRSGARVSMPGMMDTVLNLGLNDETVKGLAKLTSNDRFAYDSYRRFIQMFADVVKGVDKAKFDEVYDGVKEREGIENDADVPGEALKEIVDGFKEVYKREIGEDFPQDPTEQLLASVQAVFMSWNNPRAVVYRRLNDIPGEWGTAVNVQTMVFGNMGDDCGTGVAFTRDPATGEDVLYGEYLLNAQGEDVVAGIRTPDPISTMKEVKPEIYKEFAKIMDKLEKHYRDMQDVEFTIERGKLYMLQTRSGKRTAEAALKIAVDMVKEGIISKEEALLRVEPNQLDAVLHPTFKPEALEAATPIAKGLPASPGAATGKVYFTAEAAVEANKNGEDVVLVRVETSPEDIEGMHVAEGILTGRGGMTSHAAVVARGMGTCCVAGCHDIQINEAQKYFMAEGVRYNEGDFISLDGNTGNVYGEAIETQPPVLTGDFTTFMEWSDEYRTLKVRTNADTPNDARQAVEFGAEGIGLCRTEHMFFEEDRIPAMREMIVSRTEEQRRAALAKLLPIQKADFKGIYEAMEGRPVTVRLLDPPLHEFLPHNDKDIESLAKQMDMPFEDLKAIVDSLQEFNPMLGHRGCRLAITYPEIAEMQTKAIIEAAIEVNEEKGYNLVPEIMVPLVGEVKELTYVKNIIDEAAKAVMEEKGVEVNYLVGTMIEVPRAALTSDAIAKEAEFFSFGTNDMTQMAFGFSRDDATKFLDDYYEKDVFEHDPFERIDQTGVGKLMEISVELGKSARPDIDLGICGEHGGDPSSVEFCHRIGLDYVSCSPFRVPIAKLAAAQAKIKENLDK
ncbi:MAG: pyruvate, phosphate dikinase [Clostridiales bacterium]|nr:pyruvate, phosphate dikinase [Clostridiales bacterium]